MNRLTRNYLFAVSFISCSVATSAQSEQSLNSIEPPSTSILSRSYNVYKNGSGTLVAIVLISRDGRGIFTRIGSLTDMRRVTPTDLNKAFNLSIKQQKDQNLESFAILLTPICGEKKTEKCFVETRISANKLYEYKITGGVVTHPEWTKAEERGEMLPSLPASEN